MEKALHKSHIAEYIAHSYFAARLLGKPVALAEGELANLRKRFGLYGRRENG